MNRELLEKPFDLSQIKQREGNFGKVLDYIEGHAIIHRLNDSFEAEWSFSILKHEVLEKTEEVIVLGQLRAGDVVKTQFGSSKITRARESGEPISLADDLKAAGTDCLKKCATVLGIGLHLYNGNTPSPRTQDPQPHNRGNGGRNNIKRHWNGVLQWFKSQINNGICGRTTSMLSSKSSLALANTSSCI